MLKFAKTLTLVGLIILTVVFSLRPQTAPIQKGLEFKVVFAALGGILVIVMLVERVTEIAISILRQSGADALRSEIEALANDPARSNEITQKRKDLATYQAETKSIALLIGFSISVAVCAAGVGLLETILNTDMGNRNFLRGVDIILTSGLIAGGSDSFHQFVSALETFFKESRKRMETNP
jgi:hypothetical protein